MLAEFCKRNECRSPLTCTEHLLLCVGAQGTRAWRRFPEYLVNFLRPQYLCKTAECFGLLSDFFREPLCFYDYSAFNAGFFPNWYTNEVSCSEWQDALSLRAERHAHVLRS